MKLTRPYLLFLNPIYWVIAFLRNLFYDLGIFKSSFFNLPIIVIGNLSTGGTGKTPHTEYLISLLSSTKKVAVLSRGYGRKIAGFQTVKTTSTANEVGDEPAQIKKRFPNVAVVVDADRVHGVQTLLADKNQPEVILLDDAFQHRKLQAGFYILLTPFQQLFTDDFVLPAGNLREPKSGYDRANVIVVTKCPPQITEAEKQKIINKIKPKSHQEVFFSAIVYSQILSLNAVFKLQSGFVLVTGIANPAPLLAHLAAEKAVFKHHNFPDHYAFSKTDTEKIIANAKQLGYNQVLTTEKDFQRLDISALEKVGLHVAYLPISIQILEQQQTFNKLVLDFVSGYD